MNDLTEKILKEYQPRLAIVAYTPTVDSWNECYLESHEINKQGQLCEGKPLKQDTIQAMLDVFFDERQNRSDFKGLIPENVLKFEILPGGNYHMIWYRPEEKRYIHFAKDLHLKSGMAWMPAMIYSVDSNNLDVFALNSSERPTETTRLFYAPFHNVSSNGSVCLGSAKVKKPSNKTFSNVIKYWEDMFWMSEFTHLAHSKNPTKTNLNTIWKKMVGGKKTWSDLDELVEINKKTLNNIL